MSYVGWIGVANQSNTTPGCADGVTADASEDYGDDVGGSGVVDLYSCFVNPPPSPRYFILMEDSGYVLQESGSKIYAEVN